MLWLALMMQLSCATVSPIFSSEGLALNATVFATISAEEVPKLFLDLRKTVSAHSANPLVAHLSWQRLFQAMNQRELNMEVLGELIENTHGLSETVKRELFHTVIKFYLERAVVQSEAGAIISSHCDSLQIPSCPFLSEPMVLGSLYSNEVDSPPSWLHMQNSADRSSLVPNRALPKSAFVACLFQQLARKL